MTAAEALRESLEARMERDRDELGEALRSLRDTAAASLGPRAWIRERPIPWVLGAFVVGCLLGRRPA